MPVKNYYLESNSVYRKELKEFFDKENVKKEEIFRFLCKEEKIKRTPFKTWHDAYCFNKKEYFRIFVTGVDCGYGFMETGNCPYPRSMHCNRCPEGTKYL